MRRSLTIVAIVGTVVLGSASTAGASPVPSPPPPPPSPQAPPAPGVSAGHETSAAALHGWGEPNRVDEFDGKLGDGWNVYDGPGHADQGRRTPDAVSFADGIMTITGSPQGDTAGMAWDPGQHYGRWEGRVKAPASDESYNALLLLWPDAEDFPVGGEIDFMEMMDHTRQTTNLFLHYGEDNDQVGGEVQIDATQWHNWAVEWAPTHVAAYVDGKEWWRTENTDILPPRAMHLCVQLDWFPEDGAGEVQESQMHVDWVKQYLLPGAGEGEPLREGAPDPDRVLRSAQRAPSGI
jgi:licheninase